MTKKIFISSERLRNVNDIIGIPSPIPPSNFHSPFDGMLRYMISRYSMIALRHIHNPDKQIVLQIFTRNSYFSLDWSSLTWHRFRLLLSISLGQIGISLTIPIALKRFTHGSEYSSSPSSLRSFIKWEIPYKVLTLGWLILVSYV